LLPLYLALAAWAIVPPTRRPPPRRAAAALTLWCLVGLVVIGRPPARGQQVDCTFLALGHGGCFVAQWPDGSTLMYDAGSMVGPRSASRTIAEFLWSRGIRRIDDLLLSHADVDHYNAIPALLERFAVGRIYAPPQLAASCAEASADAAPRLLATAIDRSGTPWANLEAGDAVSLAGGQAALRVLHPSAGADGASDNALSLVVELEIWGRRLLLTGDLESAGLDRVVASPIGQCDVVLAPHHGSMRSAPVAMAAWSRPRWVVISGKALEEHQATRGAYAAAGARVLHTSEQGAVMVAITPEHVAVTSHLSSPLEARRQQSATRSAGGRGAGTAAANLPPIN
jgi:competence protein ComEC